MKLAPLLAGVARAEIVGPSDVDVAEVRDDSRVVAPHDMFVAVPGAAMNGLGFVADAVARGAGVLLVEKAAEGEAAGVAQRAGFRGTVVSVPSVRLALGIIAANRYASGTGGRLTLTAVTGTNGKTTTTYLLEAMLRAAGLRAGVLGTISYRVGGGSAPSAPDFVRTAPLTTPGALALHGLFSDMRDAGATDVVLEASSHALDQGRLEGCRFRVAGLTNLTQDHLDYHGTMAAYFDAKAILFERLLEPAIGVAVLPFDRPEGLAMRARVHGQGVLGVATRVGTGADVAAESVQMSSAGLRVRMGTPEGPFDIVSPLVGDFNLANIVLAVGMAVARGLTRDAIESGIRGLNGVPGRLERVPNPRQVLCVVDYAHTPDALERAIAALRPLVAPGGRLITLFGCGGDRDHGKRPLMGRAATEGSDLAIVTSDNPRTEDPEAIIAMIVDGIDRGGIKETSAGTFSADLAPATRGFCVIPDRRTAIGTAVAAARPGDVVLLAGKGHEDYQIIGKQRLHFDDREEAARAFAADGPAKQDSGQGGRQDS